MSLRPLVIAALVLAPVAARAADDDNPFKGAKVGDYAKYDTVLKTGKAAEVKTVRTQTVTAASEKEVSLKTVTELNGKEVPTKKGEQKIDLTKPFDPAVSGETTSIGAGLNLKWEKQKTGKEKVKVGDKEYECTWTTYKAVVPPNLPAAIEGEVKVWLSKDVPFVVKRALNMKVGNNEITYSTELTEFGNKK